jgi:hypothetical protein
MYAPCPENNFLTFSRDFPQNEHLSDMSYTILAIGPSARSLCSLAQGHSEQAP